MLHYGLHSGYQAIWLENGFLRIGVLPDKGADIFQLTYLPAGVQFLMETPWGLKPPGEGPPAEFLENYEGGWQELFPNCGDACTYRGRSIPMHGEIALLPWEHRVIRVDEEETAVHFQVRCQQTPFQIERTLRLKGGEAILRLESRLTNLSDEPWEFVWGHHITLGGNFLEDGCRVGVPARRILTPAVLYEPETARLAPGQDSAWPIARSRQGTPVDLRRIPGPQARTHDDAFLTRLERGHYEVINPRLNLGFHLDWDAHLFPWIVMWQPYGGADLPPLTGIYGLGLEPWLARYPLDQAASARQAARLEGGETLETSLTASVISSSEETA